MQSIAQERGKFMLERSSIFHQPADSFAYAYSENVLHIRLKAKKGNIEEAELIYGDQYEWNEDGWVSRRIPMKKTGSDELFDYWLAEPEPEFKRTRYGFCLKSGDEQAFYTEKGFFDRLPEDPGSLFCFPYLHSSEVFRAPKWVKDTVWYQIFPERFANGDESLNPPGTKPWRSEEPQPDNFFGGDFQGIIDHIDYLAGLGITGIYFTPIFKAYSNHKYDTIDYYEIDPQFGDKETFRKLVKICHEKGIKVMLDAVFNHSGYQFGPFQDLLENQEESKYKDWFHAEEFPLEGGERPNYSTFAFVESMPKLNTQNPETKEYLLEVGRYWVREFDIDGWRLDVANEIDHQFWREFRAEVKSIKPDLYILGEIWHDSMPWLRGDQFDAVMNYPFLTNVLNLFAKEAISPRQFAENMVSVIHMYPDNVNEAAFNLAGSHDTPRVLTECGGSLEKARLIFTFMMTYIGTPCIYYGDEVGLSGGMDPGCRECMPWNEEEYSMEMFEHIKKLIQLRKSEPLLANEGSLEFLELPEESTVAAFSRSSGNRKIVILLNASSEEASFSLPFPLKGKKITDLLTEEEYAAEADSLSAELEAYGAAILSFEL